MIFPFELAKLESKTSILNFIEPKFQSLTLNNLDYDGIFSKKESLFFNDLNLTMKNNENEKDIFTKKKIFSKSHSLFDLDFFENVTEIDEEFDNQFVKEKKSEKKKNYFEKKDYDRETHLKECLVVIKNYQILKKEKLKKKKIKKNKKIKNLDFNKQRKISLSTNSNSLLNSPMKIRSNYKSSKNLYKIKQRLQTKINKIKCFWNKKKIFLNPKIFKIAKININIEDNYIEEFLDLSGKYLQINSMKKKLI